ncbi:hypothetical protein D3C79_917180 [compost metagenome]
MAIKQYGMMQIQGMPGSAEKYQHPVLLVVRLTEQLLLVAVLPLIRILMSQKMFVSVITYIWDSLVLQMIGALNSLILIYMRLISHLQTIQKS